MARTQSISQTIKYTRDIFAIEDGELRKVRESAPLNKIQMQIGQDEGKLIYTLLKLAKVETVLEIGTFVGYSTLWIAKALPKTGEVISIEKSKEHFDIAEQNLLHSDQASKIRLICADAKEYISVLGPEIKFDAVFIDADKTGYPIYLNLVEKHLNSGSLIIADNTLLWGSVHDDSIEVDIDMKEAMQKFNLEIGNSAKFDSIMIPTEEGLVIAIKK
jgi:predicted O-methyltransferase YrrM